MSIKDPLTGKTRTVTPAELDGSTVVEVWIERLDPSKGEDFGWEKVTTRGSVKPQPDAGAQAEAAPMSAVARFVSAPELARAPRRSGRRATTRRCSRRVSSTRFSAS